MSHTDSLSTSPSTAGSSPGRGAAGGAGLDTVKQDAAGLLSSAQDKASQSIESGKHEVTSTIEDFAGAVRRAGDELAQHDRSMASQMVRHAADGLERFAHSVSDKRPSELLDAVRQFGRTNPAAFAAGAALVGLTLGRFVRSSEHHAGAQVSRPSRRDTSGVESAEVYGMVDPQAYVPEGAGVDRAQPPLGEPAVDARAATNTEF
jgi:hypothetical protein